MAKLVEINNLCKRFESITAVDQVSFSVDRGEVLGFLGPNGAGKSTTMKMITGFLTPDSGRVVIGGDDLAERAVAVKRRIGYLPEGAPLYADMTPLGFLHFVGEVRGLKGEALERRVAEIARKVQLEAALNQPIDTLSKGFKRRVGIAQAILHDPEVLVLDEPTDGLDPNQKHEVRALIREMAKEKAIILSTHILEEVDAVCSRAIIIASGRIVADGTPAELEARSPRHNAVSLRVRGHNGVDVDAVLKNLPGVAGVEHDSAEDGRVNYLVRPEPGRAVLDEVAAVVRERGWQIEQLRVERGRLDEVFREITRDVQATN